MKRGRVQGVGRLIGLAVVGIVAALYSAPQHHNTAYAQASPHQERHTVTANAAQNPVLERVVSKLEKAFDAAWQSFLTNDHSPALQQLVDAMQELQEAWKARRTSNVSIAEVQAAIRGAWKAFENGDFEVVKNYANFLVPDGNFAGAHLVGLMYVRGHGVAKDFTFGHQLITRAAQFGLVQAQYNLGLMSYYGLGDDRDPYRAAFWFRVAAEQGLPQAQTALGILYTRDQLFGTDVRGGRLGLQWLQRAAAQHYKPAQTLLKQDSGSWAEPLPRVLAGAEPSWCLSDCITFKRSKTQESRNLSPAPSMHSQDPSSQPPYVQHVSDSQTSSVTTNSLHASSETATNANPSAAAAEGCSYDTHYKDTIEKLSRLEVGAQHTCA